MLWQRLKDVYGSPEVIENALLKKVEDFPKISVKDNHKLRELGGILMELEAAKADGRTPYRKSGLLLDHVTKSNTECHIHRSQSS